MICSMEGSGSRRAKVDGRHVRFLSIEPHAIASRAMAGWFEEESGIRVDVHTVPYADITERTILDATGGAREYDIIQYWYPMLGSLVGKGILADISAWWAQNAGELQAEDLVSVFGDIFCMVGGRRFGIPYDGDMHILFYNKTLFAKHRVEPPETWDAYLEVARIISEAEAGSGVYGCGIMAVNVPMILIGTFLNRLASFGGGFFDEDGQPTINSPEAVAALEHLVSELPYAVPEPAAVGFDELLGPWLSGRVGMAEFWADLGKMTDNPQESKITGEWGVVPLPKGPGPGGRVAAPLNAGWGLGVAAGARDEEAALAFLKFCLRPEIHLRICAFPGGLDPVRWSTYDAAEYREYATEALADAAKTAVQSAAVSWPTHALWPELQDALNENLALSLAKAKTASQALDATQAAWKRALQAAANSSAGRNT